VKRKENLMSFSPDMIEKVWRKATYVSWEDEQKGLRKDACGAWIKRSDYGDCDSDFGWEIDHIKPKEHGGSDDLDNLRPLQWENNRAKGDGRLKCVVRAEGKKNARLPW
jgi:hypothetical protein